MFSLLILCFPYLYSAKREELSPAFQVANPKKSPAPPGAGGDLDVILNHCQGGTKCNQRATYHGMRFIETNLMCHVPFFGTVNHVNKSDHTYVVTHIKIVGTNLNGAS